GRGRLRGCAGARTGQARGVRPSAGAEGRRMSRVRSERGLRARLAGRRGEVLSALWLMAKGYRILGFRLKTRAGEIDLLAQKGEVLAVVEVKLRTSLEAALEAVTFQQRARLRRAA